MNLVDFLEEPSWAEVLQPVFQSPGFQGLQRFIDGEIDSGKPVYPAQKQVFFALNQLPPERVQVVILGQDPYHGPGQAHGLSFSVPEGVKTPPSLKNIFKELQRSTGHCPESTDLSPWVNQGVLLLNSVLTVNGSKAGSHQKKGWEEVTDAVICHLSQTEQPMVFLLWGGFAQSKRPLIDDTKNYILETSHPSPLSAYRGFLGCDHFVLVNQWLAKQGKPPILWS